MAVVVGTAATAGKAALSASQVIGIGAGVVSAAGTALSAIGAANQASFNAKQAEIEAEAARRQSKREAIDFRRRQSRLLASARASRAASGVSVNEGSSLLVQGDLAQEIERQAQLIEVGGEIEGTRLENQAKLERGKRTGILLSGALQSGASILKPVAQAFG